MPELPEVETIVRGLARELPGRMITAVEVRKPDVVCGPAEVFAAALVGRRFGSVSRRAKNIVLDVVGAKLIVNLGMTGRLLAVAASDPEPTHLAVRCELDAGRVLLYHDVRRFGRLQLFPGESWEAESERMGVEPLSNSFTPALLHRLTRGSRVAIKSWLMDLRRVAGVGNIYASEALFRAGIDPHRPARSLDDAETTALHAAIQAVLREAIEFRGTTLLDYRDASGEQGGFSARLRVYDRAGEPCRACGAPVERIVQGGRSTFFCPRCQR